MPEISNSQLEETLRKAEVRPSSARIHILRYLEEMRNHPTADQIYHALRAGLPSLSRTSVYNTLGTLEKAGLVRQLSMDGTETRYDAHMPDHGHFRCQCCGAIYDFDAGLSSLALQGLEGFHPRRKDLLVWGICRACVQNDTCN